MNSRQKDRHRVVIVGGGFGGLYAAKNLRRDDIDVTLVDGRNFHLFQPLLYQVATGGLSPGDISSPLRAVLKYHENTRVWQAKVTDIDVQKQNVVLEDGLVPYDTLIVAAGVSHAYFGNDQWAAHAPGLKAIEDALDIRRRIFLAFERAERESNPELRRTWMTFVVIGGGPTGVELCGALAELAHNTLKKDFRSIDSRESRIILLEGTERILPTYPPALSIKAQRTLERLNVDVRTSSMVTDIENGAVAIESGGHAEKIETGTILWAAGVKASSLGEVLRRETGVALDRAGRVLVEPDLTIPGHGEIFVIGDLACFRHQGDRPLPGVAPVAMQQGHYASNAVKRRLDGRKIASFRYRNKGNLAVIGRHAAIAELSWARFDGYPAWLAWVFIHIWYLIEFDNKLIVMLRWAMNYFTRKRGARLVTGDDPHPLLGSRRRKEKSRKTG